MSVCVRRVEEKESLLYKVKQETQDIDLYFIIESQGFKYNLFTCNFSIQNLENIM